MLRSIGLAALLLLSSCCVFAAPASAPCAAAGTSWECIGMVEIRVGGAAYRISRYANNEMLADIEANGSRKRYLVAQPSGTEWYFGLSPQELAAPASNPFAFFDYAFALPVAALRLAFPDGPASIPGVAVQRSVVVEANPVTIRASKHTTGDIEFRLEIGAAGAIEGQMHPALLEPMDASFSLNGWERKAGASMASLKQARSAGRQ